LNFILLHCRGVCHELSHRIGSGVDFYTAAARLLLLGEMGWREGRMSSSGKWIRVGIPALAMSNCSASTLSPGALIDYRLRQHELTERQ